MNAIRSLQIAARAASKMHAAQERDPIAKIDWLPAQLKFLQCVAKVKLIRAGMQLLGKSTASLTECVWLATGAHPWQPGRFCENVWIICKEHRQSIEIQQKLWDLTPKHLVAPGCVFSESTGFGGHNPTLRFVLPDGRRSKIRIRTAGQRAASLQSATIDHVLVDELVGPDVYRAVSTRVRARGGTVSLSLTPIDSPADWLRELCEKGQVVDIHAPLTLEQLTHTKSGKLRVIETDDGPVTCDQKWIDGERLKAVGGMEAVEIDGEWEGKVEGNQYRCFDTSIHVGKQDRFGNLIGLPQKVLKFALGIDHGIAVGKQAAVLLAVDESTGDMVSIYILDEYIPATDTIPADDAKAILAMLKRSGIEWRDLDYAYGDKPAENGLIKKGNLDIADHIAKQLGMRSRDALKPQILSVKEGRGAGHGSLDRGVKWLHEQMVKPGYLLLHPRCTGLVEAFQKNVKGAYCPFKDPIDATRYALRPWIFGQRQQRVGVKIRNW